MYFIIFKIKQLNYIYSNCDGYTVLHMYAYSNLYVCVRVFLCMYVWVCMCVGYRGSFHRGLASTNMTGCWSDKKNCCISENKINHFWYATEIMTTAWNNTLIYIYTIFIHLTIATIMWWNTFVTNCIKLVVEDIEWRTMIVSYEYSFSYCWQQLESSGPYRF